jgi:hypothetical protein
MEYSVKDTTRAQLIRELTTRVYDNLLNRYDPDVVAEYEDRIRVSLGKYTTPLLIDAMRIVGTAQEYDRTSHNTAAMLEGGDNEGMIRAYWHFAPLLIEDTNSPYAPQYLFDSLCHYPELASYTEGSGYMEREATRKCAAVMNVMLTLSNQPDHGKRYFKEMSSIRYPLFSDPRVVSLIAEHPEQAPRIMKFIEEGKPIEYGYLRVALGLEDGSLTLSTGVL